MSNAAAPAGPADRPPPTCLVCHMTDPPPEQTCTGEWDHVVGADRGCPACSRLITACTRRPCSARR